MASSRPVRASTRAPLMAPLNGKCRHRGRIYAPLANNRTVLNAIASRTRIDPGAMNGVITFRTRIKPGAMNGAPTGEMPPQDAQYRLIVAVQTRTVQQELREHRYRTTGSAFGFTGAPCGAGDIEVRPVIFACKTRQ